MYIYPISTVVSCNFSAVTICFPAIMANRTHNHWTSLFKLLCTAIQHRLFLRSFWCDVASQEKLIDVTFMLVITMFSWLTNTINNNPHLSNWYAKISSIPSIISFLLLAHAWLKICFCDYSISILAFFHIYCHSTQELLLKLVSMLIICKLLPFLFLSKCSMFFVWPVSCNFCYFVSIFADYWLLDIALCFFFW